MSFRRGLPKLLGKKISGYIVTQANRPPQYQLYLAFDDGTTYEIYSAGVICGAGELDPEDMDAVLRKYKKREVLLHQRIDPTEEPYGPQKRLFKD